MKIHIEENDKPLTKEQVELLTKKPTTINCKLIFGPSKPIKITNDEGIWRRINMRLTKELPMGSYRAKTIYLEPNRNEQECIYKLGQLEDIEEDLGIDLTILSKLSKATKIYTKDLNYPENGVFDWDLFMVDIRNKMIMYNETEDYLNNDLNEWLKRPLKDYGKTWALTEEELL